MQTADLSSLVRRCIAGDKKAWDTFVLRFSGLIIWAIKERLKRTGFSYASQEIEDIFQNVFVLLWEKNKLRQLKDHSRIPQWLVIIAANCATDYLRAKKETPCRDEKIISLIPDPGSALNEMAENERIHLIEEKLFKELSAREQVILRLHYLCEKTHEEIGELLRLPQNTVSSIIKRSKDKLRDELDKLGAEDF